SRASMQRYEVARLTVQQRRNQKRSEKIVRRGRGHRRTETLSVTAHSLAISVQRIPRLTDRCSGGRTEKTRRGDALIRKKSRQKFELFGETLSSAKSSNFCLVLSEPLL